MRANFTLLVVMVAFLLCCSNNSGCASAKGVSDNVGPVVEGENWSSHRFLKGGESVSESEEEEEERGSILTKLRNFMKKGRLNSKQLELVKNNPSVVKQFEAIKKNPSFNSIKSSVENNPALKAQAQSFVKKPTLEKLKTIEKENPEVIKQSQNLMKSNPDSITTFGATYGVRVFDPYPKSNLGIFLTLLLVFGSIFGIVGLMVALNKPK